MKLEQFTHVIEVAKTGSFSQAARNLYISQPNLSHSVKQMEKEIGFALFVRTSSGAIPTEQGREAIEHFKIIHREYLHLQKAYNGQAPRPKLSLRVASINTNRMTVVLPSLIGRYLSEDINFSFMNYTNMDALIQKVTACEVDFALIGVLSPYIKSTRTMLGNLGIEYHKLSTVPVSVVVGPHSPFYSGPSVIAMEDLRPCTVMSYGDHTEDPAYCLPLVAGIEHQVRGHVHVNSSQLFYQTIQRTPVVGLIASTADTFGVYNTWSDVRILSLADCPVVAELAWIKLSRVPLSGIAAELIEACKGLF